MTLQTADPPVAPSAQVVANAFVEQYYHILHHSPELVFRFYQDSSVVSRQDENGEMISVTTMQGINEKILSLDYKNYKAEIKTADAQESHKDGVTVLVTGCLTGKDNLRKKFAQSFFLAPQSKGYFVLNDVFRYIDESEPLPSNTVTIEKVDDSGAVQAPLYADLPHAPEAPASEVATSNDNNHISVEHVTHSFQKERQIATEEVSANSESENHISSVAESGLMPGLEDSVKNSYASIVKMVNGNPVPAKVYVPANMVKSAPTNSEKQYSGSGSVTAALVTRPPVEENKKPPESVNAEEGHSIFVRNLPINVMDAELEQEFKRFGPIKPGGVQVRSNRQQGSCYGFVEFLYASSVESAIKASPITIAGRPAFVEVKRTTSRVDDGRGRYPSARGGFRSDSFRGRGGYSGGRGFGGNEFGSRSEYSGRGRGRAGRGSVGYQRGRGSGGRGKNQNSVA